MLRQCMVPSMLSSLYSLCNWHCWSRAWQSNSGSAYGLTCLASWAGVRLQIDTSDVSGEVKFVSQQYTDGDVCALTEQPRVTEVELGCRPRCISQMPLILVLRRSVFHEEMVLSTLTAGCK